MKTKKFCKHHGLSVEAKESGVYDCDAQLAEARCFPCPYKTKEEAKKSCSDINV